MSTQTATQEGLDDRLNGVTISEGFKKMFDYMNLQRDKDGTAVKDPNSERISRINRLVEGLQGIVANEVLKGSSRANEDQAREIVEKFTYELAKTFGYQGDPKKIPEHLKGEYLRTVAQALGISAIGDPNKLTESIMNMASLVAKVGDPLYEENAPLVQLMRYIAERKDNEQIEFNHLLLLTQNGYQSPRKAMNILTGLRQHGIKLADTASVDQVIGELRAYGAKQTRKFVDEMPKTYQPPANPAPAQGASGAYAAR